MFMSSIKEIDARELHDLMQAGSDKVRVIDVRQPQEIMAGTLPGAEAMPMSMVPMRINELKRDEKLVVMCRSGARSAQVCMFLQQQGFDNVHNLRGGIMGWASIGAPMSLPQAV